MEEETNENLSPVGVVGVGSPLYRDSEADESLLHPVVEMVIPVCDGTEETGDDLQGSKIGATRMADNLKCEGEINTDTFENFDESKVRTSQSFARVPSVIYPKHRTHIRQQIFEKQYECPECDKAFTRSFTLKEHMRVHTGERPFVCQECGKNFISNSDLRKHHKIHTGERKHVCGICGKAFTMSGDLVKHIKVHTGEKDYECSVCQKRFTKNGNLKQHMRSHSGERPYTCGDCGKSFTQSYHLKRHMSKHTGMGGKFKCPECGKGFMENTHLRRHVRIHSGEKPFRCDVCNRGFAQKVALRKHVTLHQKTKKQLTCDDCGIEFEDKNLLYIHKMTIHVGKLPTVTDGTNSTMLSASECQQRMDNIINHINNIRDESGKEGSICDEPEPLRNTESTVYIKEEMISCDIEEEMSSCDIEEEEEVSSCDIKEEEID